MAAEMTDLEDRKRQLLARSDLCRQRMAMEFRDIKTATAWVPHTIHTIRAVYPVFLLAAPLIGYVFARKRHVPKTQPIRRAGVLASALAGYRFFRRMKPVLDGLRSRRNH